MIFLRPDAYKYFIAIDAPYFTMNTFNKALKFLFITGAIKYYPNELLITDMFFHRKCVLGFDNAGNLEAYRFGEAYSVRKTCYYLSLEEFIKRETREKPASGWIYSYIWNMETLEHVYKKWTNCKLDNDNLRFENIFTNEIMLQRAKERILEVKNT